jgi:hypothetical protein
VISGRESAGATHPADTPRPAAVIRLLDALAGLLAAGSVLVGVLLLIAALAAPAVLDAVGLGPADGPGWGRVIAQLAVGLAGEVVVSLRGKWAAPVRVAADLTVICSAVAVISWVWWS